MMNPYATSYIIAARLDRSLMRHWAIGDTLAAPCSVADEFAPFQSQTCGKRWSGRAR